MEHPAPTAATTRGDSKSCVKNASRAPFRVHCNTHTRKNDTDKHKRKAHKVNDTWQNNRNVLVRKPWLVSCLGEWVQFTRQYTLRQTAHFQLTSLTRNVNCLFYHLSSRGAIGPLNLRCRPIAATAANSNRTTVSHFSLLHVSLCN